MSSAAVKLVLQNQVQVTAFSGGFPTLQTVDVMSWRAFDLTPHDLLHLFVNKSIALAITEDMSFVPPCCDGEDGLELKQNSPN